MNWQNTNFQKMRTLGSELPTKDISRPLTSQGLNKRLMKLRHTVSLSPLTTFDDSDDEYMSISHSNDGWRQPRVILRLYIRVRHVWKCVKLLVMTGLSCQENFFNSHFIYLYTGPTVKLSFGPCDFWMLLSTNKCRCLKHDCLSLFGGWIWIGYDIAVCFYIELPRISLWDK